MAFFETKGVRLGQRIKASFRKGHGCGLAPYRLSKKKETDRGTGRPQRTLRKGAGQKDKEILGEGEVFI